MMLSNGGTSSSSSSGGSSTMVTSPTPSNNNLPLNNNNGVQLNLDHYKYLRSLLPGVPHCIESLTFGNDLHSFECALHASLASESDCLKWLADFGDNTKTEWRTEPSLPLSSPEGKKVTWGMVYKCVPQDKGAKECTAKLEMRILASSELDKMSAQKGSKQHPCLVNINFYHNHLVPSSLNGQASNNVLPLDSSFKVQDIPSHLKEQFEGYFLPSVPTSSSQQPLAPVSTPSLSSPTSSPSVALGSLQAVMSPPQQPIIPLHTQAAAALTQQATLQAGQIVILPENQQVQNRAFQSEVFSLEDVSKKLDEALIILKNMLRKSGTGCAAVKQFTDHFDRVKVNEDALENALCNFGSAGAVTNQTLPQLPVIPQWSMTVPPAVAAMAQQQPSTNGLLAAAAATPQLPTVPAAVPVVLDQQQQQLNPGVNSAAAASNAVEAPMDPIKAKKLKAAAARRKKKGLSTVLPGQIDPVTGKRRKRSRCGTCQGCINRDKTQDCRVCRNCLDQKRYGGPGRLKKACVNRSCAIMATPEGLAPPLTTASSSKTVAATVSSTSTSGVTAAALLSQQQPVTVSTTAAVAAAAANMLPITLPLHPLPVSATVQTVTSLPSSVVSLQQDGINANVTTSSPSAVLSWPQGQQFPQTFQVQQPIQFTYQAQLPDGQSFPEATSPSQSPASSAPIQLETIAAEAARHHGIA